MPPVSGMAGRPGFKVWLTMAGRPCPLRAHVCPASGLPVDQAQARRVPLEAPALAGSDVQVGQGSVAGTSIARAASAGPPARPSAAARESELPLTGAIPP